MKNLISCFIILLISIQVNGQITKIVCNFIESPYDQSNNPLAFQVSDSNPNGTTINAQIVYDDFEIDEDTGVDAICLVGRFNSANLGGRQTISTRDSDCSPGNLFLSYFEDNGSDEPGNLIMSFEIAPLIGNTIPVGNNDICSITLQHSTVNLPVGKYWFSVNSGQLDFCDLELIYDDGSLTVRENDNTRAITPGFIVQDVNGMRVTRGIGSGLNFSLRAAPLAPIPTMGQWGIIILGISLGIFALVAIRNRYHILGYS